MYVAPTTILHTPLGETCQPGRGGGEAPAGHQGAPRPAVPEALGVPRPSGGGPQRRGDPGALPARGRPSAPERGAAEARSRVPPHLPGGKGGVARGPSGRRGWGGGAPALRPPWPRCGRDQGRASGKGRSRLPPARPGGAMGVLGLPAGFGARSGSCFPDVSWVLRGGVAPASAHALS